jgi:hypothetical protein
MQRAKDDISNEQSWDYYHVASLVIPLLLNNTANYLF